MNKKEILLKEYETCQSEVGNRGSYFWVSLSIIISINLLLLIQVPYTVVKDGLNISRHISLLTVPLLGLVMIFINIIFYMWQKRQHYITDIIHQRMQKIEDVLGMHRNWLIRGRDLKEDPDNKKTWKDLPATRKVFIEELLERYPNLPKYERPVGHKVFGIVLKILIILWILLIILIILLYFWPAFRAWLVS